MKFTAAYKKIGGWFVGWIEEIPGVNTQGKTLREVKENLREALALVIETNRSLNKTAGKVVREVSSRSSAADRDEKDRSPTAPDNIRMRIRTRGSASQRVLQS